jgi:hypothetical protein
LELHLVHLVILELTRYYLRKKRKKNLGSTSYQIRGLPVYYEYFCLLMIHSIKLKNSLKNIEILKPFTLAPLNKFFILELKKIPGYFLHENYKKQV